MTIWNAPLTAQDLEREITALLRSEVGLTAKEIQKALFRRHRFTTVEAVRAQLAVMAREGKVVRPIHDPERIGEQQTIVWSTPNEAAD